MGIHRILVLAVLFFLVALCPNLDLVLIVFVIGIAVYSALWWYDIFTGKDRP